MNHNENEKLIGSWVIIPEKNNIDLHEIIRLDFKKDGQLIYSIISKEKKQVILLSYRIENDILITDQPTQPQEERTKFLFISDNRLMLEYEGQIDIYERYTDIM